MSRATNKTHATEKGTEYPPLPMSIQGDTNIWSPISQTSKLPKSHSRTPSKAPSVSPSDSPSQAKYRSSVKSPATKLKSIPSEDGSAGESPKRGNGNRKSEVPQTVGPPETETEFLSPNICSPLASKPTIFALQTCPNNWRHVCHCCR
jgi:hypothetical protein